MDPESSLAELRDFCTERRGPELGERVAGLVRPGFDLVPAVPDRAAGRSRFGGDAMLEPGVPWPTCEGLPLSLLLTEFSVPGALVSEDLAFGRPVYPTGSGGPALPDGEDLEGHQHLLQLSDQHEWHIGGDGGWMHWSIPTDALRVGDFTHARPTPDIW